MKQQHSFLLQTFAEPINQGLGPMNKNILADSKEVMQDYYHQKIALLQSVLCQLTILDNAREIVFLCNQIREAGNILKQLRK